MSEDEGEGLTRWPECGVRYRVEWPAQVEVTNDAPYCPFCGEDIGDGEQ